MLKTGAYNWLFIVLVSLGSGCKREVDVVARIGDQPVRAMDLKKEYWAMKTINHTGVLSVDPAVLRKTALDFCVTRIIILDAARKSGIAQSPEMKAIAKAAPLTDFQLTSHYLADRFKKDWRVSAQEINLYYETHPEKYGGKPLSSVSTQIISELQNIKFQAWLAQQKIQAKIEVDQDALNSVAFP